MSENNEQVLHSVRIVAAEPSGEEALQYSIYTEGANDKAAVDLAYTKIGEYQGKLLRRGVIHRK